MSDLQAHAHATSAGAEELLKPLVTCGICMELYVDPIALLDCLHLACGSCATQWLKQSDQCHQCRERVCGTRDNHHTVAVVEAYRVIAPDSALCQARTPEEIASMHQIYRPGESIITHRHGEEYSARGSDPVSPTTVTTSAESSPTLYIEATPLWRTGQRMWGNIESTLQFYDDSCPFCDPENQSGFVCPRPCTRRSDSIGQQTIPVGHTICSACARFLPIRGDLTTANCVVCNRTTCLEMGQRCRIGSSWENLELAPLQDVDFSRQWEIPLTHAFAGNPYENRLFVSYFRRRDLDLDQLFREVLVSRASSLPRATWHGLVAHPSETTTVNGGDKVCRRCASDLLEAALFEWWLLKRTEADLPVEVMSRPDCGDGIECRTALNDTDHALNYNHICRRVASDHQEDNNRDTPEDGSRYVAQSTNLRHTCPPFNQSDLLCRDKGKEPVFLCSSVCGTTNGRAIIPGKVTLWGGNSVQVYYGLNGREHEHNGVVRILVDTKNMHWVRTSMGIIPTGCRPVTGGEITTGGVRRQLYHCVVWWRGQRVPGYTSPEMGNAAITWGGRMWYFEDQYDILCWD